MTHETIAQSPHPFFDIFKKFVEENKIANIVCIVDIGSGEVCVPAHITNNEMFSDILMLNQFFLEEQAGGELVQAHFEELKNKGHENG